VIHILCRRTKNNPVLIGEAGVGKTAIVEGLAQRSADGEVTSFLADERILALDLSLIVAGTKYRGQLEERMKTIMTELMESQNSIIFIDELHTLVGVGSAERSLDAGNILKPALSRGKIQCIGATALYRTGSEATLVGDGPKSSYEWERAAYSMGCSWLCKSKRVCWSSKMLTSSPSSVRVNCATKN